MSMPASDRPRPDDVVYPESDGKPMAENPLQGAAIRYLVTGFQRLFHGRSDTFVGGDFFWYPVEGDPTTVAAPDVTVIVNLPGPVTEAEMPSYRQWVYGGQVLVAVEVLSPSNTWREMTRKFRFYERHGVQEYWVFEPEDGTLHVFVRDGEHLVAVSEQAGVIISPTTGVRVWVEGIALVVADPDGRVWRTPVEEVIRAELEAARADLEAARADAAEAEVAALRAELARLRGQ
jgi:Uma2 family endonuclease